MSHRLSVVIVVIGAVGGAALIAFFNTHAADVRAWVEVDPRPRVRLVLVALSVAIAGPVLACSAYLWFVDRRRVLRVLAAVLTAAALGLVFFLFRLVNLLERAA